MAMILQQINRMSALVRHQFFNIAAPFAQQAEFQLQPLLIPSGTQSQAVADPLGDLFGPLWLAVPKQKVTRSKKRMKTTAQKRIKLKKNIIVDPRTGEYTLKHKLPFNWKEYLPKLD